MAQRLCRVLTGLVRGIARRPWVPACAAAAVLVLAACGSGAGAANSSSLTGGVSAPTAAASHSPAPAGGSTGSCASASTAVAWFEGCGLPAFDQVNRHDLDPVSAVDETWVEANVPQYLSDLHKAYSLPPIPGSSGLTARWKKAVNHLIQAVNQRSISLFASANEEWASVYNRLCIMARGACA
jgi:hypothetical protein